MMGLRIIERLRRFRALDPGDRWLIVEALILVGLVHAGLRTLPFATMRRLLAGAKRLPSRSASSCARLAWAVHAAARLAPGGNCLSEALVVNVMLCRRGFQPTLCVGVRKADRRSDGVEAHAWVECDGSIVTGGLERLDEYRPLPLRGGAG